MFRCPRCGFLTLPWSKVPRHRSPAPEQTSSSSSDASSRRLNPLGIQMLSTPLHRQVFGNNKTTGVERSALIKQSIQHLKQQNLWGRETTLLPELDIQLPSICGKNLDEHFRCIARAQSQLYLDLAKQLVQATLYPMPREWSSEPGWTRYDPKTRRGEKVECPLDDALVLDVECCVSEGQRPTLAVAVSPQAWYSWVSDRLKSSKDFYIERETQIDDLIPLEVVSVESTAGGHQKGGDDATWRQRIVVGHNVSYDRARIKEQYLLRGPKTKFLDTLSLHTCVAGQTSRQKGVWTSRMKKLQREEKVEGEIPQQRTRHTDLWMEVSSPGNLADVHWLHVRRGKRKMDKTKRDVFVKGTIQDIRKDFQNLMRYCAEDVFCTHEVLKKVFPRFLTQCPHPVTFAGMLEMGSAYLPLNFSWKKYIDDAESTFDEMQGEVKAKLRILADNACFYSHDERYLESLWLCNLDWSSKKFRGKAIKTKKGATKLLEDLEKFYQIKKEEFVTNMEEDEYEDEDYTIISLEFMKQSRPVHMPGYPEWYRDLCMKRSSDDWKPGPVKITAQTRVTPYLLRMKWNGHPLHHHTSLGWGYVISPDLPKGETPKFDDSCDFELSRKEREKALMDDDVSLERVEDLIDKDLDERSTIDDKEGVAEEETKEEGKIEIWKSKRKPVTKKGEKSEVHHEVMNTVWGLTNDIITLANGKRYFFFKLPHKDGSEANCGNPLSKDYLPKMEDGTLTSAAGQLGQHILLLNSIISYWRGARSRILQQFVVNLEQSSSADSAQLSAILPLLQVAGTVTRRAVEPTWLTASNAKENRVGSELKAMVRAPPGYHLVGADVDSQELWIAAVLGDMHFAGIHGCTGVGWMTLQGSKVEGTDVHSNTAKTIGISRDHAKILNYGRIYGAGLPFIKLLLHKFNPSLSQREREDKAMALHSATKGRRMYKLNRKGVKLAEEMDIPVDGGCITHDDWKLLCSGVGYFKALDVLMNKVWCGGSESDLFNKIESIALSEQPRTPVLGCCISKALNSKYVGGNYQPSKVNWVVQSSAVDYLHLMLVCTKWLFKKYNIDGRFCISIHDEVRYLVKSEDRYRAALALQFANLFTRAMFAHQLKMYDLPLSVAFFSAVDIDLVLRKEPTMDCKTPSNPHGLEKGHGIPPGEALGIHQLLEKTNSLEKNHKRI